MNKKHKCCICGKIFIGFGNNPWGALDKNKQLINWSAGDLCCDKCNNLVVVPDRIYRLMMTSKKGGKK